MEESKKEGYIAGGVLLVVGILFLVVGFDSGWQNQKIVIVLGAIISLFGGLGLYKPESIGEVLAHYIKGLAKEEKSAQKMTNSPKSTQQKAGRDAIINKIDKRIITSSTNRNVSTRQERNEIKEEEALRKIRAQMVKTMKIINTYANIGVKDENEFRKLQHYKDEFEDVKLEYQVDIDPEMLKKFNEVMGSFRKAVANLHRNLINKSDEGLHGLDSFDFIKKVDEVDILIRKKLNRN